MLQSEWVSLSDGLRIIHGVPQPIWRASITLIEMTFSVFCKHVAVVTLATALRQSRVRRQRVTFAPCGRNCSHTLTLSI